jgi:hypothetical protein
MEVEPHYYMRTCQRTLADGTVKSYTYGVVAKGRKLRASEKISQDDLAIIRRRIEDGVTLKRICEDYDVCHVTLKKLLA